MLSKEGIKRILESTSNIKHKAILIIMYCGKFRVGEVVKLKSEDIDLEWDLVYIKGSKGKRDRYTILSRNSSVILKKYYTQYEAKKQLFEGAKRGKHISTRTVQAIFKQAYRKLGVKKENLAYFLRHLFATHLLESRVDLRYIQEILKHKSSKTTEVTLYVSKTNIARIRNPLDIIFEKEEVMSVSRVFISAILRISNQN